MGVHQSSGAIQLLSGQIRPRLQQGADPFLVNPIGPFRLVNARDGEMHQKVAKWRRVQHARVIYRGERAHG